MASAEYKVHDVNAVACSTLPGGRQLKRVKLSPMDGRIGSPTGFQPVCLTGFPLRAGWLPIGSCLPIASPLSPHGRRLVARVAHRCSGRDVGRLYWRCVPGSGRPAYVGAVIIDGLIERRR